MIAADVNAALVRGRVVRLCAWHDVAVVVRFARVAGVIETRGYDVVSEMLIRTAAIAVWLVIGRSLQTGTHGAGSVYDMVSEIVCGRPHAAASLGGGRTVGV